MRYVFGVLGAVISAKVSWSFLSQDLGLVLVLIPAGGMAAAGLGALFDIAEKK